MFLFLRENTGKEGEKARFGRSNNEQHCVVITMGFRLVFVWQKTLISRVEKYSRIQKIIIEKVLWVDLYALSVHRSGKRGMSLWGMTKSLSVLNILPTLSWEVYETKKM